MRGEQEMDEKTTYLDKYFMYHAPTPEQLPLYSDIRAAGANLAEIIWDSCPEGADRSAALRLVREAVMTANASIACS